MNGWSEEIYDEVEGFEAEAFGDDESEAEYDETSDFDGEWSEEGEGPFGEDLETELAAELLTVSDEAELDQFLGKLIGRAAKAARRFASTPAGQRLKAMLRDAAKKAVPVAGRKIGTYFGGAKGGDIGADLATKASQVFGLELEGLSPEDQEFQVARRFVRFAGDAAQRAGRAGSSGDPRSALVSAARRHAPGLLRGGWGGSAGHSAHPVRHRTGRWVRRGRTIVLYGV